MNARNIFQEKSFDFAVKIVKLCNAKTTNYQENVLNRQLLRSGTAVGALIREAQNAESTADFIHKLAISQKECDETCYWLEILYKTDMINEQQFNELHNESTSLLRMIRSSIITTKNKRKLNS